MVERRRRGGALRDELGGLADEGVVDDILNTLREGEVFRNRRRGTRKLLFFFPPFLLLPHSFFYRILIQSLVIAFLSLSLSFFLILSLQ